MMTVSTRAWVFDVMSGVRHYFALARTVIVRISISHLISSTLRAFGVLWVMVEIVSYFFPDFVSFLRSSWWVFLVIGVSVGAWRGRPKLAVRATIAGTDAGIEVRVGDLFQQDGAFIISAPTSFDTSTEDGTIDEKSVQGQYTKRFCDSLENLDRQIEVSLDGVKFETRDKVDKPFGSRRKYPVGTVANVTFGGKKAYFVAIATLNSYKNATATRNELLDALPVLWENLRSRGGIEPINVPVLGSGFSRLNATREQLIREIAKSFVAATHSGKFTERLRIVISLSDYHEKKIDLEGLGRFLEQECAYSSFHVAVGTTRVGTAV